MDKKEGTKMGKATVDKFEADVSRYVRRANGDMGVVPHATQAWKFLGTDDAVNTCDCCGREDLKSTVALESNADGHQVNFGVTCAARALKWTTQEVKAANRSADDAKAAAERTAKAEAARVAHNAWLAFLMALPVIKRDYTGAIDIASTCAVNGGIAKLRSEFYASQCVR
jgi:hypothetical protein